VRLYGKALEITRSFIRERQGHNCALCQSLWREIDHIDGNPANNNPSNLRGLCKRCNIRQRNLAAGILSDTVKLGVCVADDDAEDSMEKNSRTERAWVEFVTWQLDLAGSMRKDLLTGMSAFQIDISVATVSRHWKKYSSPLGPFEIYRPNQGTSLLVRLRTKP